jgi:hypothetical protein
VVKKWCVEGRIPGVWVWSRMLRRRRRKSLAREEMESIAPDH